MKRAVLGGLLMVLAVCLIPAQRAYASDFDLTFERGKSYAVMSNSVARGDRDHYYFGASAGQMLTVGISSLEDNAVVELYVKREGAWLPVDQPVDTRVLYGALSESDGGQYRLTVGGTRGNATYDMFVGIAVAGR